MAIIDALKVRLGDYLTVLTDYHANGSYEKLRENVTLLDIPDYAVMIRTTNFENEDFVQDLKYINEHAYNFLGKSKVYPGDILMNKIASPGSIYRMPNLNRPTSLAMNLFLLRTDVAHLDQTFAYFWLKANEPYVKSFSCGAATATITKKAVRELELPLPPLSVQRKIAAILSAYDDLIGNNVRRIKILEEMLQNLYREWFVKFRFPGHQQVRFTDSAIGQIPEGWEARGAMENANWSFINQSIGPYEGVKRYYATADIDGITITGDGIEYAYNQKPSRAQKQPLLFSVWFARMQDTYKVLPVAKPNAILATSSMLSSGFAGFKTPDEESFAFLFLTINSKEFHSEKDRYCTGATQRSLTNDGLSRILTISPPREIVRHFGHFVMSFVDLILALQLHNQVLRRTRDLLLPRLISGEVDVSELDIVVPEEVAA